MTILDESFIENFRLGSDPTFFIVSGVCYAGQVGCVNPPAITPYNCYAGETDCGMH